MTDTAKLATWFAGDDTGISSATIAAYMSGADMTCIRHKSPPADPSDLGRCLRLLELFPEWKPRMQEMASISDRWARILPHWNAAARKMKDEVGIDWSKGKSAPETYRFMKSAGF